MKHVQKEELFIPQSNLSNQIFTENSIFFDIETTGFSPSNSIIYLIGCMRREKDKIIIDQFLAEHKEDEEQILISFLKILECKNTIISFNGIGFDIPFIKAKCSKYNYKEGFQDFQYIDIFKLIGNIKFLLKLPNYKQKTIENFLEISRNDIYNGGELINVFYDYLSNHSSQSEEQLLLHNYEDVLGMLDVLPVLTYLEILNGKYAITELNISPYTSFDGEEMEEMIITLHNDYTVPKRVSYQYHAFYISMNKDLTKIRIPIFHGELKYFFPNYKEYFYLPKEDLAIHKSVATFVDKEYREKAKASNCYNRKSGLFLPQYNAIMQPSFKKDYKDKLEYFELTEDFSSSDVMLRRYISHIFEHIIHAKDK